MPPLRSPWILILLLTTSLLVGGWRLVSALAASIPAAERSSAASTIRQIADLNSPEVQQIALVKTVGLDANACATTQVITVPVGTQVTYCYRVENTGDENLVSHSLSDDQLGIILNQFSYTLVPGASVFLTQTAQIQSETTNIATWTAETDVGRTATSTDSATVNILNPSLVLAKTVGLDPNVCAATTRIRVAPGTPVTYCYRVENTGAMNLVSHTLVDDQLGTILNDFAYTLTPSASVFLTQTATINGVVANTATWSAATSLGAEASGTAQATVEAAYFDFFPLIRRAPGD